jgi:GntR family transcriptional regulator
MFFISINDTDATPVYRQIVDNVRSEIAAGRLKPGENLPSVRELAANLNINVNTVHKAYQMLRQMKIVVVRQARGVIVAPQVGELFGSRENEGVLAEHIVSLLAEADRLGFSAKDVVRMIMKSKHYPKRKGAR